MISICGAGGGTRLWRCCSRERNGRRCDVVETGSESAAVELMRSDEPVSCRRGRGRKGGHAGQSEGISCNPSTARPPEEHQAHRLEADVPSGSTVTPIKPENLERAHGSKGASACVRLRVTRWRVSQWSWRRGKVWHFVCFGFLLIALYHSLIPVLTGHRRSRC